MRLLGKKLAMQIEYGSVSFSRVSTKSIRYLVSENIVSSVFPIFLDISVRSVDFLIYECCGRNINSIIWWEF